MQRRRRHIIIAFLVVVAITVTLHVNNDKNTSTSREKPALHRLTRSDAEDTGASGDSVSPLFAGASKLAVENLLVDGRRYDGTDHLVVVPGHGVFRGLRADDWRKESLWGLEAFQAGEDGMLTIAFSQHIKRGVIELLAEPEKSILIFSGGQTKRGAGPRSEGLSYYIIAEQTRLFGLLGDQYSTAGIALLESRIFSEDFARDSYENVLFSICRFREITGRYPARVTVVNWEYKRERFEKLHRTAIRFPADRFNYVGIDFADALKLAGEKVPQNLRTFSDKMTVDRVRKDMYVCEGHKTTRITRNPNFRVAPYLVSCPELSRLLLHCGPDLFGGPLPWDP